MRFSQFVLGLGVVSLLLAVGFIARTDMVLGPTIHSAIEREVRKLGADLIVEEMRPFGLISLEFRDVWIRIPRGDYALEIVAERVQVRPDLNSLMQGTPRPSSIKVINGHGIWRSWTTEPKPTPAAIRISETIRSSPTPAPTPAPPRIPLDVDVTLVNVTFESRVAPVVTTAPLKFNRLDVNWTGKAELTGASGYGVFPDHVPFGIRSVKGTKSERIRLEANSPTELSAWIEGQPNPEVSVGALSICLKCVDILKLEDAKIKLEWRDGANAALETPAAYVAVSKSEIELKAQDMEFPAARDFGLQARVTDTRITFNPSSREIALAAKFVDTEGGRLDVQASLGASIRAKVFAEDFDSSRLLDAIHAPKAVRPGLVTGTVEVHYDIYAGTVDTTSVISATDSRIEIARLSSAPLELRRTKLRFDALLDLDGAALSVSRGRLDLGPSAVLSFGGRVLRTGDGAAFEAFVGGENILAATIRDAIPEAISQVAEDAILDGTFGFNLRVQGNTEDSSELVVDGFLEGDVEVLRDSPGTDPHMLISAGPPPDLSASLSQHWRTYQQLPVLVPQVLLSAEDASFFRHPGFDWEGLKAAMAHNLEQKSFERGGSTISQQVAKNVFLNHERTIARKLQEAYLTWRMEQVVPKERILEIYLNIADWGGGVQGIERAAQRYFKTSADQLTAPELALLAAILPNPSRFGGHILKGKIARSRAEKVGRILLNLRFLNQIDAPSWSRWSRDAENGKFGRLELQICEAEC